MNLAGPPPSPDQRRSRRFPRYRTQLDVSVQVLGPDGHFQVNGLCNQIGEGGLGAIIGSELTVGEMVNLQLLMPGMPQPVSLRAVVRWRDRLQHGFEFFGTPSEDRAKIHDYCKDLSEEHRI